MFRNCIQNNCSLFTFQPNNQRIKFKIYKREPFKQLNSLNHIQDKSNYDTVIKLKSDKAREVIPVKQTEFYKVRSHFVYYNQFLGFSDT